MVVPGIRSVRTWVVAVGVAAGAICLAGVGWSLPQRGGSPGEYEVKAAFVYNFMKFVEWPSSAPPGPLVIGVGGAVPMDRFEAPLKDRTIQGRAIEVRPFDGSDLDQPLHVLFVGPDAGPRVASAVRTLGGRPILTVADAGGGLRGAMITLVQLDTRLGFDVDYNLSTAAELRISAQLLSLARQVTGGPRR